MENDDKSNEGLAEFAAANQHLLEIETRSASTMHLIQPGTPDPGATVPTQHLIPVSPPPAPVPAPPAQE